MIFLVDIEYNMNNLLGEISEDPLKRILMTRMNKFILLCLFGLIPTGNASFLYIVNHEGINIESKCQDGKAEHQIWHIDDEGKVQKLNLKGHGTDSFKIPKLKARNIYKSEKGFLCSQRQLTKKEGEAFDRFFHIFIDFTLYPY